MEDCSLDVEVGKTRNYEVVQPFDLSDPVYVESMDRFVENKQ